MCILAICPMTTSNLTVSLEPHLSESLQSIKDNLPDDVRKELVQELSQTEVHYSLLLRISQWARTEAGTKALKTTNLPSGDLQMVSLLAGTRTSPSSKLPPYIPPESDELRMQRESNERRALAFVINGFLSVICAGGSTWWAANKAGWKPEWVRSRLHFRHLTRYEVNSEHIIEKKNRQFSSHLPLVLSSAYRNRSSSLYGKVGLSSLRSLTGISRRTRTRSTRIPEEMKPTCLRMNKLNKAITATFVVANL